MQPASSKCLCLCIRQKEEKIQCILGLCQFCTSDNFLNLLSTQFSLLVVWILWACSGLHCQHLWAWPVQHSDGKQQQLCIPSYGNYFSTINIALEGLETSLQYELAFGRLRKDYRSLESEAGVCMDVTLHVQSHILCGQLMDMMND